MPRLLLTPRRRHVGDVWIFMTPTSPRGLSYDWPSTNGSEPSTELSRHEELPPKDVSLTAPVTRQELQNLVHALKERGIVLDEGAIFARP